jgi:tetratricopeptide (TPR) repeat protein
MWQATAFSLELNEDSLLHQIAISKDENTQINNYIILANHFRDDNIKKAERYYQLGIQLTIEALESKQISKQKRNKLLSLQSELYNDYGYFLKSNAKFQEAIVFYKKSINVQKLKTDSINESDIATTLVNIGNVLNFIDDIPNALEHFLAAAKMFERINDEEGIAFAYKFIATNYETTGNLEKANFYNKKAIEKLRKLDIKIGIAYTLLNQTRFNLKQNKKDLALNDLNEAISIFKETENERGVVEALIAKGALFEKYDQTDSALYYFNATLKLKALQTDLESYFLVNYHLASVYYFKNDIKKALPFAEKAWQVSKEVNIAEHKATIAKLLSKIYADKGNYKEAFKMQELFEVMHDSVFRNENKRNIIQKQFQYEYDKKAVADSIKINQEKKIFALQLAQQQSQKKYLFGLIILIGIFTAFVYNRLQITRNQKNIISAQKAIVDEKQKEILDSITYAKRIQNAIIPGKKFVDEKLKNYFIFYKPKDIVAGDFYWINSQKHEQHELLYIAVCDCTGHGVPGAMVSVVCENALNRSLIEFRETMPGKIFDKARGLLLENFAKRDEEVKDGMDATLCAFDMKQNKLWWSGANIPLWIIRGNQFIEIKPDKQPIGKGYENKAFTTHEIALQKNDTIFLFSDGFADQFGGEKNKKMTKAKFKEKLLNMAALSMTEQKQELELFYENYRGNEEQIDDVCVLGFRV